MSECIFCKIIKGEIPAQKVYDDKDVVGFLDIMPIALGHTLIVPKKHCRDVFDTPENTFSRMANAAKLVAVAVRNATRADGIHIGMNNGGAAGQSVFHAHIHVIPRFSADGFTHWPKTKVSSDELVQMGEQIQNALHNLREL